MLTEKTFADAPEEFAPVAFWFLNHLLEKEEGAWQIAQMKQEGVAGFFMHPREGLLTPYLSEAWFDFVSFAVEEAERQGLKAWLYDEDPCPSGIAGGKVTLDHPEFRACGLQWAEAKAKGPGAVRLTLPLGGLVGAFAISVRDGRILDLTDKVGMLRETWACKFWHSRWYYPAKKVHHHWRSATFFPRQVLVWDAPEGEWTVLGFASVPYADDGQHGTYTDLLNPEAVEFYLKVTHEGYKRRVGKHFGGTIPGIFTDEAKYIVPFAWSHLLPQQFRQDHGYDLVENLPHLVKDLGPETAKVRHDYRETLLRALRRNFFGRLGRWCKKNNLLFIGHASPEEDPYYQVIHLSDLAPHLETLDIPGTDIIIPAVGDHDHEVLNLGPKLVSSVACQQGKKRVLCESFACCEWELTMAQMKHITDYLYVLGVNMLVPHAFSYSIDGYRKRDAAPSQFYQATYWPYYQAFADYVRRLGYVLSSGRQVVDLAMVWPMRKLWELIPSREKEAIAARDETITITNLFLNKQWDFHYVPEDSLSKAQAEGAQLRVGKEAYRCLLLSPTATVSPPAQAALKKFARGGGIVIDMRPEGLVGARNWIRCDSPAALFRTLEHTLDRTVRIEDGDLIFFMRRTEGQKDIYFFVNLAERRRRVRIWARSQGSPRLWDVTTGKTSPLRFERDGNGISFTLDFTPAQSYLIISQPSAKGDQAPQPRPSRPRKIELNGPWKVKPLRDNFLVLHSWQMRIAGKGSWTSCIPSPLLEHLDLPESELRPTIFGPVYAGESDAAGGGRVEVEYRASFQVKEKPERAWMVLEKSSIKGKFTIHLNGSLVGPLRRKRIYDANNLIASVGRLLEVGNNQIKIKVVADPSGGLLEPVRLMGNFGASFVTCKPALTAPPTHLKIGSWTGQGLPFYSGTISYEMEFALDELPRAAVLSLPGVADMADVWVNGRQVGLLAWPPYEREITPFLKPGRNNLRLDVTNSMANLLDAKQKPSGLLKPPQLLIFGG